MEHKEDEHTDAAAARPRVLFEGSDARNSLLHNEPEEHGSAIIPPFYGTSNVLLWDTETQLAWIDPKRRGEREENAAHRPLCEEIQRDRLLDDAGALYGYFPVITDDDLVVFLDPSDMTTDIASIRFPRVPEKGNRSFADLLMPEGDMLAVVAVTLGTRFVRWIGECRRSGTYNGYEDRFAGTLATEFTRRVVLEISRGLGLAGGSGRLFALGDPGMPPGSDMKGFVTILALEERLGITLTDESRLTPEHSTLGIYLHRDDAWNP